MSRLGRALPLALRVALGGTGALAVACILVRPSDDDLRGSRRDAAVDGSVVGPDGEPRDTGAEGDAADADASDAPEIGPACPVDWCTYGPDASLAGQFTFEDTALPFDAVPSMRITDGGVLHCSRSLRVPYDASRAYVDFVVPTAPHMFASAFVDLGDAPEGNALLFVQGASGGLALVAEGTDGNGRLVAAQSVLDFFQRQAPKQAAVRIPTLRGQIAAEIDDSAPSEVTVRVLFYPNRCEPGEEAPARFTLTLPREQFDNPDAGPNQRGFVVVGPGAVMDDVRFGPEPFPF